MKRIIIWEEREEQSGSDWEKRLDSNKSVKISFQITNCIGSKYMLRVLMSLRLFRFWAFTLDVVYV